jgi:hypothetical protein
MDISAIRVRSDGLKTRRWNGTKSARADCSTTWVEQWTFAHAPRQPVESVTTACTTLPPTISTAPEPSSVLGSAGPVATQIVSP